MRKHGMRMLSLIFLLVAVLVAANGLELFNGIYSHDSFHVTESIIIQEEIVDELIIDKIVFTINCSEQKEFLNYDFFNSDFHYKYFRAAGIVKPAEDILTAEAVLQFNYDSLYSDGRHSTDYLITNKESDSIPAMRGGCYSQFIKQQ